jgi:adenosine kinase
MKVVITGSIAFDYLMTFPGRFQDHLIGDQLDNISVSFLVDSLQRLRGGVAPNIAYTNALLGGRPKIMAAAGRDFHSYGQWLESNFIDISGIVVYEERYCASFFVNTDQDQNQIASFYSGAMADASKLSFSKFAPDAELVVISPNDPGAMIAYVKECKSLGIRYIYDPSQQTIPLSAKDLLEGISDCFLLAVNDYELSMIREKTGLSTKEIIRRVGSLLVTYGKHGARICSGDEEYDIPAIVPNKIADPTGAGDAFRGGLIRGIQMGFSWPVAGRMGALASTYVLENVGTQGHSYSKDQFISRYRTYFDDNGLLDQLLM